MAQDIFISYRRRDAAAFAARLRDRLEQSFPRQVFLDVAGMRAGDDFPTRLREAVLSSRTLVAVIGPGWVQDRKDEADFVVEEVATALAAGIHVVPVLVEETRMPAAESLPEQLRPLAGRHAVTISHQRFESDVEHLVDALYAPLGMRPPGTVERILELAGFGKRSKQLRDNFAVWSLVMTGLAGLAAIQWLFVAGRDPAKLPLTLSLAAAALGLGLLGRHAQARRWMALTAAGISAALLAAMLAAGVWRSFSLPRNPWMESMQLARSRSPGGGPSPEVIAWTPRVLFYTPLPTVACECLERLEPRITSRPLPADAHLAFTNHCKKPVTLAVARIRDANLDIAFAWIAGPSAEYAVITLLPGEFIRVPLSGSYGAQYQPWVCEQ